jgi:hypothetical protein
MKKAEKLREHLLASVPWLKKNPDKLFMFIEGGRIGARRSNSLSFTYSYDLKVLLIDCPVQFDLITVPLLAWLAVNQSERLHHPDNARQVFEFVAEVIDKKTTDLELTLQLTENVLVEKVEAGHSIRHLDEPALPEEDGPTGWAIFGNGAEVLPTPILTE